MKIKRFYTLNDEQFADINEVRGTRSIRQFVEDAIAIHCAETRRNWRIFDEGAADE